MAGQKDYSSIYSIKEVTINTIAPKYFNLDDINQLNIGLFGYTTEMIANTSEDTFNTVSTFLKEIFPNLASIPESIYNYAALFQLNNLLAVPAHLNIMIFLNEKDIINSGTNKGTFLEFILDSNLVIDIEGKHFMLDYDIAITAKPYLTDYIFTAQYKTGFTNSLSTINNPYIKIKRIKYTGNNYLGLFVTVKQVDKTIITEQVFNNDKINFPTFTLDFVNQLANFEILYKPPGSLEYIQLQKRLINTPAIDQPFCYYSIKTANKITINFSTQSKYFQPKFNSEFEIRLYTTLGSVGNFPTYTGSNVVVTPKSETYVYNNGMAIFAIPQSESIEGMDYLTLEELRSVVLENYSTIGSFTNENDLQIYFSKYKDKYKNEILFIKKRDDVFERLFSAFTLLKDINANIYLTNTLNAILYPTNFDEVYTQENISILKPGHLFRYRVDSFDVELIPNITLTDDLSVLTDDYVFTNLFLITVSKSPGVVGYYVNSLNEKYNLDYEYVNSDSIVQFICNTVNVYRNALLGNDYYTFSINIAPSLDIAEPLLIKNEDGSITDLNLLKLKIMIEASGVEICYLDTTLVGFDETSQIYTFEATLNTNDYMSSDQFMQVLNVNNINDGSLVTNALIPMYDCKINIYSFYKYPDVNSIPYKIQHNYDYIVELQPFTLTNKYSTIDTKIDFITPLNILRSMIKFNYVDETNYTITINSIPFISANAMKDTEIYDTFMKTLISQYTYMQEVLTKITNNFGIDMKFYNTYGKSKNFITGETGVQLDSVNTKLSFKVKPTVNADVVDLVFNLKIFIKKYIESINNKGSNGIYISNLTTQIENNFSTVEYIKFSGINNYDSSIQVIENKTPDITLLSITDKKNYVPEYLTISLDDIIIALL